MHSSNCTMSALVFAFVVVHLSVLAGAHHLLDNVSTVVYVCSWASEGASRCTTIIGPCQ